jgi:hypothetical protein
LALLGLFAAASALLVAPIGFGFSGGITKDNAGVAEFEAGGCTACHGPGAPHADFAPGASDVISWTMTDAEGNVPAGNTYEADVVYTINITLLEERNAPSAANHAGFNLRASAGELAGVEGISQVSGDGTQATHTGPGRTDWQVTWTAPGDGVAVFDLFVNDVDGSGANDAGDQVLRVGWFLTDESHTLPGAAAEHVEFGITLQQYWIGLIGLAGMIFIMVAGFVYLKFVNPHNTDQKDR